MKSPAPTPGRAERTTFLSLGRGFCAHPYRQPGLAPPGPGCCSKLRESQGAGTGFKKGEIAGWVGVGRRKKEMQREDRETETPRMRGKEGEK